MSVYAKLRASQQYKVDPIVAVLVSLQILINTFLAVKYSSENLYVAVVNLVFIALTITGLTLHHFFAGGVKFEKQIHPAQLTIIMLASSVGFLLVVVFQTITFRASSSIALATIAEAILFYYTAGVSEETFFRYYLQTKAEQSLPIPLYGAIAAIVLISTLFTTYHFGVYGTDLSALYAVFLSSLVLGSVYYATKRLSVVMLIHVLVNVTAAGVIPR